MNTKKIISKVTSSIVPITTIAMLLTGIAATPAFAQSSGASASTTVGAKTSANQAARLSKIITRSDTAIAARISDLNKLSARIQDMKNVSSAEKTNISNEVQTNITGLTSLKAKIDADTDVTVALADEKTIYGSFRIYALVVPQGYIAASADRVNTIVGLMTAISAKLQARITTLQAGGRDVTALQSALADLNAKIADAKTQADKAQSGISSLTPDQGNKTQLDSNTAALKTARLAIKTATKDLEVARQDEKTIIQGLKVSANGSASTTSAH